MTLCGILFARFFCFQSKGMLTVRGGTPDRFQSGVPHIFLSEPLVLQTL